MFSPALAPPRVIGATPADRPRIVSDSDNRPSQAPVSPPTISQPNRSPPPSSPDKAPWRIRCRSPSAKPPPLPPPPANTPSPRNPKDCGSSPSPRSAAANEPPNQNDPRPAP